MKAPQSQPNHGNNGQSRTVNPLVRGQQPSTFFSPDPRQLRAGEPSPQQGQPLESSVKGAMGTYFEHDFSGVRVYKDQEGDKLAKDHNAAAVTFGNKIAFRAGTYKPGTPGGDALIAHELAHVVQQDAAPVSADYRIDTRQENHLEKDANSRAFGYLLMQTLGLRSKSEKGSMLKSRRKLSACTSYRGIEAPSYLGEHSLEALRQINRIAENSELLEKMVVVGVTITTATSSPEEQLAQGGPEGTMEAAIEALRGVPAIRRNRIHTVIDLLIIQHGNDMNSEERAFWERIRALF